MSLFGSLPRSNFYDQNRPGGIQTRLLDRDMSCSSSSGSEGEEEGFDAYRKGGYHAVRIGDPFSGGRYIAQRKLGWGQFSTVWLAYDTLTSVRISLLFPFLRLFCCFDRNSSF